MRARRPWKGKSTAALYARLLEDPDLIRAWGEARIADARRKLELFRRHLERITCSSRWFDDVWARNTHYPPPAMVACTACGRFVPPGYVGSSGACTDCRLAGMTDFQLEMLPKSRSVIDFRGLLNGRRGRKS